VCIEPLAFVEDAGSLGELAKVVQIRRQCYAARLLHQIFAHGLFPGPGAADVFAPSVGLHR
jgi:hypothetical protein